MLQPVIVQRMMEPWFKWIVLFLLYYPLYPVDLIAARLILADDRPPIRIGITNYVGTSRT
jgi:hypothetical protein